MTTRQAMSRIEAVIDKVIRTKTCLDGKSSPTAWVWSPSHGAAPHCIRWNAQRSAVKPLLLGWSQLVDSRRPA